MRNFLHFSRKIVAVGRNYAQVIQNRPTLLSHTLSYKYSDHCKEMGKEIPKSPIFFLKPPSSFVRWPDPILLPDDTLVEHEVEVAVIIGKSGRNIREDCAFNFVSGYALALDLTARDLQREASEKGLPWFVSKGFDTFTPIGTFIPARAIHRPHEISFSLEVNGKFRQMGNTRDMIFPIPKLIAEISKCMTLQSGDVLLTGTPGGVGPLKVGDKVVGRLEHDLSIVRHSCLRFPKLN